MPVVPDKAAESPPSALDYVRVLRRRKWWLIGSVVAFTGAAIGYSYSEPDRYTGVAQVVVQGMPNVTPADGVTPQPLTPAALSTDIQLITSSSITAKAEHILGVKGAVTASAVGTSNVLRIAAIEPTPHLAAWVANVYASAFAAYEQAQVTRRIDAVQLQLNSRATALVTLIAQLEHQLGTSLPGSSDGSSGSSTSPPTNAQVLQAQLLEALGDQQVVEGDLAQLQGAIGSTSPAQIVSPATAPPSPSSPKTTRNTGLGLGGGVVIGIALCLVVDTVDDRIRSKSDLETVLGEIPVLGIIPSVPMWKDPDKAFLVSLTNPRSGAAESYRSLRTALQFVLLDKGVKRVLISSAIMGEGKTATTANLAVAMARAGLDVLAVSADLRRPRLGEFLDCDESVGLCSIALGTATFEQAVKPVPGIRGLSFLGTGPIPPDPAEFLASATAERIMSEAADRFDLVVIDCAPVMPVADTLAASQWADAVVLVARGDFTRRRHPRHALELLSSSHSAICGAIFNDVTRDDRGYKRTGYYGYYGYYGGYGYYGYGNQGDARHRRSRKRELSSGPSSTPTDSSSASGIG